MPPFGATIKNVTPAEAGAYDKHRTSGLLPWVPAFLFSAFAAGAGMTSIIYRPLQPKCVWLSRRCVPEPMA